MGNQFLVVLYAVYHLQINYLVPRGVGHGTATVTVISDVRAAASGKVRIVKLAPGLFAANTNGQGPAAAEALRASADGFEYVELLTQFDQTNGRWIAKALDLGLTTDNVYLILYATGIRGRSSLDGVTVSVGGVSVPVLYAGPQNQYEGLDKVKVGPLPRSLQGRGEVSVSLMADGKPANAVTIRIR
jgi:uncharacterized protein (TIGR03437 family)